MSILIDKTGWPLDKEWATYPEPYIVDQSTSGVVYKCWSSAPQRVIWRYTTAGNITTTEYTYGAWADRATLTYVAIDKPFEVAE